MIVCVNLNSSSILYCCVELPSEIWVRFLSVFVESGFMFCWQTSSSHNLLVQFNWLNLPLGSCHSEDPALQPSSGVILQCFSPNYNLMSVFSSFSLFLFSPATKDQGKSLCFWRVYVCVSGQLAVTWSVLQDINLKFAVAETFPEQLFWALTDYTKIFAITHLAPVLSFC